MQQVQTELSAIVAEANSTTQQPRAAELPLFDLSHAAMGAADGPYRWVPPKAAHNIAAGMNAYLNGLTAPLYSFFGTGYLG